MLDFSEFRVAIVHEWFETWSGAEQVVEQLVQLFPHADLFGVVDHLSDEDRARIGSRKIQSSFIQSLPFSRKLFRAYLPLMPLAIEGLDLSGYDLVISSNHSVAKGVITGPGQVHISYMHSPMRYAWDIRHQYVDRDNWRSRLSAMLRAPLLHYLRLWDRSSGAGVDHFVANSRYIAQRIEKVYRRSAEVIYPPVAESYYRPVQPAENHYVVVSRLVRYKRIDLLVEAFRLLPEQQLVIIGDGPESERLQKMASANVRFTGKVDQGELLRLLCKAKGFVYAGEEDFGIAVAEAQAVGVPLIVFARGGQSEIGSSMGMESFSEQQATAIADAVRRSAQRDYDRQAIAESARRFSEARFRDEFAALVTQLMSSTRPLTPQSPSE